MNLSNRLTFSLVFSVLLVAGFALVPAVMAAEGGPTATITIDDSSIIQPGPDDDIEMTDDNVTIETVDGTNVLLTNAARDELVTSGTGNFRVKVSFSEAVFGDGTETDTVTATVNQTGDLATTDTAWTIVAGAVVGGLQVTGVDVTAVTRVDTNDDPDVTEFSKTDFLVTLSVSYSDVPLVMTLTLNEDQVFGVGTAFQVVDGVPQQETPGTGNQEASRTFTVIPKVLLKPVVVVSATKIGLDESATVTLTFDPAPTGNDVPTRRNIIVTKGSIKPDDPTTDGDDGLYSNADAAADPNTIWTIVVIPQGGIGTFYTMKVEAIAGAPFVLSKEITVDSTPLEQRIDLTSTSTDESRKGGAEFTVSIVYNVAPSDDLTAAGVTVTGGTKGTFSGSGANYMLVVDPTDPAAGATGTLKVSIGQYSKSFDIPGVAVVTDDDDDDDDATSQITSDAIAIPKNSFVVVVRDATLGVAEGSIVPEGHVFRAGVTKVEWATMPNLQELFDRTTPGGGGALAVEDAADPANISVGKVGISEIMWGIDEGHLGLASQSASQWIELHNISDKNVMVKLHSLTGRDITDDTKLTGNLTAPIIDVVTNFFNNRPGGVAWDVPGSNGNTVSGTSFVSMARILPDKKDAYADADKARYNNRDGRASGHWTTSSNAYVRKAVSVGDVQVVYEYKGTPGQVNSFKPATQPHTRDSRTNVPSDTIVINEVANRSDADKKYEWIELRNASGNQINLRKYRISKAIDNNTDQLLIDFPNDDKAQIPAGGVLLLVASDPATDSNHPLVPGRNVSKSQAEHLQWEWNSPIRYKVISFQNNGLPDSGKFVLIVRRPDDASKNNPAELGKDDLDKIVDIAGWDDNLGKSGYSNAVSSTDLWPLKAFKAPFTDRNSFKVNTVHRRQYTKTNDGRSGVGAHENKNQDDRAAFRDAGFTGVGYKRRITGGAAYEGTPGYDNNALKSRDGVITGPVYISEIMYAGGQNDTLPQWIELRNPSKTVGANLHNWRLTIINHDSTDADGTQWGGKADASILLNNLKIDPNSAVLIASSRAPRFNVRLPNTDIFTLFPAYRNTFGMSGPGSDVINIYGFKITLHAKGNEASSKWQLVDEVSNLVDRRDANRGERTDTERYDDPRWAWPDAHTADGNRISVARANMNTATEGYNRGIADGKTAAGWVLSSDDGRTQRIDVTYYGHENDKSTPGQNVRSPLPVSLSYFRPTLENGEVVIRWTTESELDNAGFNILRSDSQNGEFKQVNSELVQGAGTTGERNTYKWVDESAKLGVVYYYQIEDVSFAGERQTLTTTKLKGLISAKNKLTTLWGGLKSQD